VSCPDGLADDVDESLELAGRAVPVLAEPETAEAQPAHNATTNSAAASNR